MHSSIPTPSPEMGDLWFDTDQNILRVYEGGAWMLLDPDGTFFNIFVDGIFRTKMFFKHGRRVPSYLLDIHLTNDKEYAAFLLRWA